ncbi:MAG: hypothetical protein V7744_08955 [Pseudomonadales bacterium]
MSKPVDLYKSMATKIHINVKAKNTNEDKELYQKITSSKSRQAADNLFSASVEDLIESYDPEPPKI